MDEIAQTVAKILLELNAVTLNSKKPYRWVSGILAPIYCDCRILMAYPDKRKQIRDLYIKAIRDSGVDFEVIAATATAGIPHAAWIADQLNLPMVYVRGKAKDHGKENLIEGIIKKGQKAIIIEDLISTGGSSINTASSVRKAGGDVSYIFSIMTYQFKKADENFAQNNLKLTSLTNFSTLVSQAQKMNYISKVEMKIILEWSSDPAGWGKKMGFE